MAANTTFVRITNQQIYQKLCDIENQAQSTTSKVNINRWIASTALAGVFGLTGWVIVLLSKF